MIREGVLCIFLCACGLSIQGQSFQKLSASIGVTHSYTGQNGAGGSFYDWDKDGLPDIVLTKNGSSPQFYHNIGDAFEMLETPFIEDDGNIKSLSWADFDNDGDADITLTRYEGAFSLYENDGDFNFTDISESAGLPVTDHYTYGHSWGDYDRDGDLDLYICNYHFYEDITNYLFRNNGDGTFTEVAEEVGLDDGNNYSFQAVWCDLNFDGWQDLFIINDKESPNSLYLNNGDGTFYNYSSQSGADIVIEAMSNSIADYDNDSDFDIYMTNAIQPNALLRSDGVLDFADVAVNAGVTVDEMCWGALFFDYDNNGWDDLLVSTVGVPNELFTNEMNGQFSPASSIFAVQPTFTWSFLKGDINQDGKEDLINIEAAPSESTVWRNVTINENHYISFGLTGVVSNRDAFGSRIEVYTNGLKQMKHLCSSENYLAQNAQYLNFGLGEADTVDSVFIAWPSGWTEKWYDLDSDQRYNFLEGESLQVNLTLSQESPICSGDSIVIDAGQWESYQWNSGEESSELSVDQSGWYSVQTEHYMGFIVQSDSIYIETRPLPQVEAMITDVSCAGASDGAIELLNSLNDDILSATWNNNVESLTLNNLLWGNYIANVSDEFGCVSQVEVELTNPPELEFETSVIEPLCFGGSDGSINLTWLSGNGEFSYLLNGEEDDGSLDSLTQGAYELLVVNENGCTWEDDINISSPSELILNSSIEAEFWGDDGAVELNISGGIEPYSIIFNGEESSELIDGISAGIYTVSVIDSNGCELNDEVVVEDHTLVDEQNSAVLKVYPNPAHEVIYVVSSIPNSDYTIVSISGELLMSGKIGHSNSIDISELPVGIYLFQTGNSTLRLLKTE